MNTPRKKLKTLLLSGALLLSTGGQAQAQIINPAAAADVASYVKQVSGWLGEVQNILNMKDKLFDSSQWVDLISKTKLDVLKYAGLNNVNLNDLQKVYGQFQSLQSQIAGLKDDIGQKSQSLWNDISAAGLRTDDLAGAMVGLSPDLATGKDKAATAVALSNEGGKQVVDRQLTSAAALQNSMDTNKQVADRSVTTLENSAKLAQAAVSAQSTREVTQVVAQGIAQLVADNALNTTAITASLAQQAKQTEVLNGAVNQLVQDKLDERRSQALAQAAQIDSDAREAVQQGKNVGNIMNTAAEAMNNTIDKKMDLDFGDLYR